MALRRQQTSQDINRDSAQMKNQSMIALLAQKRVYQKHLRDLQQTTLAKDICQGKNCFECSVFVLFQSPRLSLFPFSIKICGSFRKKWTDHLTIIIVQSCDGSFKDHIVYTRKQNYKI